MFFSSQLSQDMNAMQLSQNQNHPLLTNSQYQHTNSFPEPPASHSPNPNYQPYWQQPPPRQQPQNPGAFYNNTAGQYPPNSSTDRYPTPPPHNAGFLDRTMPPVDKQNMSHKMPNQDMYPPSLSMNQLNKAPPYSNGTGFAPPPNQFQNSNMQARYPPASPSPSLGQSNMQSNVGTAGQFSQASNALPPQNRMGPVPQPAAAQNRRLDPDNMPSPVCLLCCLNY